MVDPVHSQRADLLTPAQLDALLTAFRDGAREASIAWSRWVGRHTEIAVARVDQLAMAEATELLGAAEEPLAACVMTITGRLSGALILAFDDASGWALADLLLDQPPGTASQWGEVERSAALETANIVGCAYLNALSRLFQRSSQPAELLPSPPKFTRDFAATLLQFALLDQAMVSDVIFLTETTFHVEETPANWNLLFVPSAGSVPTLGSILT